MRDLNLIYRRREFFVDENSTRYTMHYSWEVTVQNIVQKINKTTQQRNNATLRLSNWLRVFSRERREKKRIHLKAFSIFHRRAFWCRNVLCFCRHSLNTVVVVVVVSVSVDVLQCPSVVKHVYLCAMFPQP